MKIIKNLTGILFCMMLLNSFSSKAQVKILDQVVGVVGANVILQSDIESQYQQFLLQGGQDNPNMRCEILYQMLINKLLLNQAVIDSLEVSATQVDEELDKRMRYYIQQIGSQKQLEEHMGKSVIELKAEFRSLIKDQMLTQQMQQKITKDVNASPADVKNYYEKIPKDSLPRIESEFEIQQIVKNIAVTEEQKKAVKDKLEEYKQQILKGDRDFVATATLYSQDPGSYKKGGELGFFGRGDMQPAFEAAAFKLRPGEISDIIETPYGFHILQLIERRGDQINVRHILLRPKVSDDNINMASLVLDSIRTQILNKTITFADAAQKFSDDVDTKYNAGLMQNTQDGTTKFDATTMDKTLFFQIDQLKIGEISKPVSYSDKDQKAALRLLLVKSKTAPHTANLKDDYQKIRNAALADKQNLALLDWVKKRRAETYVSINKDYLKCDALKDWVKFVAGK
jgi:peptidyl-prolyl cis-trans isomerase SurA